MAKHLMRDSTDLLLHRLNGRARCLLHHEILASVYHRYLLFFQQMRDSALPADVLLGKLNKDISFALRRGTIAQVTTAHDAAQRAVEDEEELVLNAAGLAR